MLSIFRFDQLVMLCLVFGIGESYCSVMQAWGAKQIVVVQNPSPMKADLSSVPVSPSSSIGSLNRAASLLKSSSRRSYRRKMVADCKALRAQIHDFEQEFTMKNNRLPKVRIFLDLCTSDVLNHELFVPAH